MQRLLSVFLAACMLIGAISVMPVSASAESASSDITVYFADTLGWGDVNVFYRSDGHDWLGTAMEKDSVDENSRQTYKAEIPADSDAISFNGNGNHTVIIDTDIADGKAWYTTGETDGGNYIVEHYDMAETASETATPDSAEPETTATETAAPETTTPETAVPETTVPETTVPETTVSETIAEETVPETKATEPATPDSAEPETAATESTTPETQPVVGSVKYYIIGSMTNWEISEDYAMTANEAADTEEYIFTLDLTAESRFKVAYIEGDSVIFIPEGMGNSYGSNGEITADGTYTVYFRPNGDGEGWFNNCIYVSVTELPTDASEPATPDSADPETTAPETTVEETMPEETVPETTAPETTAPETTAPETTPSETIAEETVPETKATEPATPDSAEPETAATESTTPETQPVVGAVKYYIIGSMTNWEISEDYAMTANEAADTEEYIFTLDLTAESRFKVAYIEGDSVIFIPEGMGNSYGSNGEITADGTYTVYFRPNGNGEGWFNNCIYVSVTELPTDASEPATPDSAEPETTAPETTAPETTVEETMPEETVPETTAPETTAPETAAPETTPSETIAEETVPETKATEPATPDSAEPETAATESTTPETQPVVGSVKYYIIGSMTNWEIREDYAMTANEAADTEEYIFTLDLTAESQFKIAYVEGDSVIFIPEGMGNSYGSNGEITADGTYTVYFRPNGGGEGWFNNCIYVSVTELPTDASEPATTDSADPETTAPETTVEETMPEETVPETTAPETTAPETTPSETIAEETTSETTVPETTSPETTAPETTAPETTVPETQPATEPATEPVPALNGIVDGYCYINGELAKGKGLVEFEGDIYFIKNNGSVYKSGTLKVLEAKTNGLLPAGAYTFDAEGKLETVGIFNGCYYVNGVKVKGAGVIEYKDSFYFVRNDGSLYKSGRMTVTEAKTNALIPAAAYNFDENGKILLNGIVNDVFYIDGDKAKGAGIVVYGKKLYFVKNDGTVYKNGRLAVPEAKTNGLIAAGSYNFDAYGRMQDVKRILNGYYYLNGQKVTGAGVVEYNGSLYYIKNDGTVYKNGRLGITSEKTNGLIPQGCYSFDANGKMINIALVINATNHYDINYEITVNPTITTDTNNFLASTGDTSDRSGDIAAMLKKTGSCTLGSGEFYIKGVDMPDCSMIRGQGNSTRIYWINEDDSPNYIFKLETGCSLEDMWISQYKISDTDPPMPVQSEVRDFSAVEFSGVFALDNPVCGPHASTLNNLRITDIEGSGIKLSRTGPGVTAHISAVNCFIQKCDCGILDDVISEFHQFTNITCSHCYYGVICRGGNNTYTNCNFSANYVGVYLDNSDGQSYNNGHGIFSACVIDHSKPDNIGTALLCDGITVGMKFVGCTIGYGNITVKNSIGIRFNSCTIGNTDIQIENSKGTIFSNTDFGKDSDISITETDSINTRYIDCYYLDGTDFVR